MSATGVSAGHGGELAVELDPSGAQGIFTVFPKVYILFIGIFNINHLYMGICKKGVIWALKGQFHLSFNNYRLTMEFRLPSASKLRH